MTAGVVIAAITRSSQDDLEDTTADLEGIESQFGILVGDEVRFDVSCGTHQVSTLITGGKHEGSLDCKTVCWVTYSDVGRYKDALLRTANFGQKPKPGESGKTQGQDGSWPHDRNGDGVVNGSDPVADGNEPPDWPDGVLRPPNWPLATAEGDDFNEHPSAKRPTPVDEDYEGGDDGIIYSETQPDSADVPSNGSVVAYGSSCFSIDDVCDVSQTRRQVVKDQLEAEGVQNAPGGPTSPSLRIDALRTIESC